MHYSEGSDIHLSQEGRGGKMDGLRHLLPILQTIINTKMFKKKLVTFPPATQTHCDFRRCDDDPTCESAVLPDVYTDPTARRYNRGDRSIDQFLLLLQYLSLHAGVNGCFSDSFTHKNVFSAFTPAVSAPKSSAAM